MKKTLFFFTLLYGVALWPQTDYTEVYEGFGYIQKGTELHEQGDFSAALRMYEKVAKTDPDYLTAQYEYLLTLQSMENREGEQEKRLQALYESGAMEEHPELYILYGVFLSNTENYKLSETVFKKAEAQLPLSPILHFNYAILYLRMEERQKSINHLKKVITYDPSYDSAHYFLGLLALEDGRAAEGCMSLLGYLIISPNGPYAQEAVLKLNTQMGHHFLETPELQFSEKGDDFSELEQILRSQLALNPRYQLKSDVDDIVTRQAQAVLEYAASHRVQGGFFENIYIPWLADIYRKDHTENFMYYILLSFEETLGRELTSKKKQLSAFVESYISGDFWSIYGRRTMEHFGREETVTVWLENGDPQLIGKSLDGEKQGEHKLVNKHLQTRGELNVHNDELHGLQRYFYTDGTVSQETTYKNGVMDGESKEFYPNGNLKAVETHRDGTLHGPYTTYFINGGKECELQFRDGERHGTMTCYFQNGAKNSEMNYRDEAFHGSVSVYNEAGDLTRHYRYMEGEPDGKMTDYYDGEQIKAESVFDNGEVQSRQFFHENGKLKTEEFFEKGKLVKEVSYFFNGSLSDESTYNKNEQLERIVYYRPAGHAYMEEQYRSGQLKRGVQWDSEGNKTEFTVKDHYRITGPEGQPVIEGPVARGKMNGEWQFYYSDGRLRRKQHYENGIANGLRRDYDPGEIPNTVYHLMEGNMHGVYEEFRNGRLWRTFCTQDGEANGPYRYFYPDGSLSQEGYNVDGNYHGKYYAYRIDGSLMVESDYANDYLLNTRHYSPGGEPTFEFDNQNANGRYRQEWENGNIIAVENYANGVLDGALTQKDKNGLPVLEARYANGKRHGPYTAYHPNGKPSMEMTYYNGQGHGEVNRYDMAGVLRFRYRLHFGVSSGLNERFYRNGKKMYQYHELKEQKRGEYTWYNQDEEPVAAVVYELGVIREYRVLGPDNRLAPPVNAGSGTFEIRSEYANGQKAFSASFKNGILHGRTEIFNTDGKQAYSCEHKDGALHGTRKEFYANGNTYKEEHFDMGDFEGLQQYFEENGEKMITAEYRMNELHGAFKTYRDGRAEQTKIYDSHELVDISP